MNNKLTYILSIFVAVASFSTVSFAQGPDGNEYSKPGYISQASIIQASKQISNEKMLEKRIEDEANGEREFDFGILQYKNKLEVDGQIRENVVIDAQIKNADNGSSFCFAKDFKAHSDYDNVYVAKCNDGYSVSIHYNADSWFGPTFDLYVFKSVEEETHLAGTGYSYVSSCQPIGKKPATQEEIDLILAENDIFGVKN